MSTLDADRAARLRARLGKAPTEPSGNLSPPVNHEEPAPQLIVEPAQAVQTVGQGGRLKVAKGSRRVPMRESSADWIDGRALRATRRNSRLNVNIREPHHIAFTEYCADSDTPYCELLEEMIEARFPQRFKST